MAGPVSSCRVLDSTASVGQALRTSQTTACTKHRQRHRLAVGGSDLLPSHSVDMARRNSERTALSELPISASLCAARRNRFSIQKRRTLERHGPAPRRAVRPAVRSSLDARRGSARTYHPLDVLSSMRTFLDHGGSSIKKRFGKSSRQALRFKAACARHYHGSIGESGGRSVAFACQAESTAEPTRPSCSRRS